MPARPLSAIENAALEVHTLFWGYIGEHNDEWPIQISCSEELEDRLCAALNQLSNAIGEVRPDLTRWPPKIT